MVLYAVSILIFSIGVYECVSGRFQIPGYGIIINLGLFKHE